LIFIELGMKEFQGIKDVRSSYLRVDFLSWFETGQDRNWGRVGVARPQADYVTTLRWMCEACDANGMFLSLVMPTLASEAAIEKQFGHSIRINEDTDYGEWWKFSAKNSGNESFSRKIVIE
jgi:hypothetical protein